MNYLKLYENFDDIDQICAKYSLSDYTINSNRTVDVGGNVSFNRCNLTKLPLKFNYVSGVFNCANNRLTTLDGSPRKVGYIFYCYDNELTSFEGGPNTVLDNYHCQNNDIRDFTGYPTNLDGYVYTNSNAIDEIVELVHFTKQQKFIKWLIEFDVIREQCKIVEMRLEEAYWMATKEELPTNKRRFKEYKLI